MSEIHKANEKHWDSLASQGQSLRDEDELWRSCPQQPALAFDGGALEAIHEFLGDLTGKQVCVIGSGDLINPLLESGFVLRRIVETPARDPRFWQDHSYLPGTDERRLDWRYNPRAGLPVWLTLVAQKRLNLGER